MSKSPSKSRRTFTERARHWSKVILLPLGGWLHQRGVHPDTITLLGTLGVGLAGLTIASGQLQLGGVILLLTLPFDAIDGAVARAKGEHRPFGALLDSVCDRYADGFIFIAFSYYFAVQERPALLALALAALLGSLLVSYVRARADGVGVVASIGWFTRFERTVVIVVMTLLPMLLEIGLIVLAIGTHLTALQRLWFVKKSLEQ